MVMPEIEEEKDLGLSINSLMLGKVQLNSLNDWVRCFSKVPINAIFIAESSNLMLNIGLPDLEPTGAKNNCFAKIHVPD